MGQEENKSRLKIEKLYAKVNFDFEKFNPVEFFIATKKLHELGIVSSFDYEYESETEVLKAVTCVSLHTLNGNHYSIKYQEELEIKQK